MGLRHLLNVRLPDESVRERSFPDESDRSLSCIAHVPMTEKFLIVFPRVFPRRHSLSIMDWTDSAPSLGKSTLYSY